MRSALKRAIRPSTTRSTAALWAKSLLNAVLFFGLFMVALPWGAHRLLPWDLPLPLSATVRTWLASGMALAGIAVWGACLDTFSRRGRGTPFPADAPRELVTHGMFGRVRNPIMAAELMVIWAIAVWLGNLGVVAYAFAITALAHVLVVQVEEPELRERFGERYAAYCRETPRWLPRIGWRRKSHDADAA